jgi:hypothetical protein
MRATALLVIVSGVLPLRTVPAVEFDCVEIPADIRQTPDCTANPDFSFWCSCLKSGLTANKGGQPAKLEQAIIDAAGQPAVGREVITVYGGTLDLSSIEVIDPPVEIGQILIDQPIGQAENFLLDYRMQVVGIQDDGTVDFDVVLVETNQTSVAVLRYDPINTIHSSGLLFKGQVKSFGPNDGFELSYQYLTLDTLPLGATHASLERGDLDDPGFSVPVLLTFPNAGLYTLPRATSLDLESTIQQICANLDPTICPEPVRAEQRVFAESLKIEFVEPPKEQFRRADSNGDKTIDLSDPVATLDFLFLGGSPLPCPDSADVNDDNSLDITDAVSSLEFQFLGGPEPAAPGPANCGPDPTNDTLGPCTYNC